MSVICSSKNNVKVENVCVYVCVCVCVSARAYTFKGLSSSWQALAQLGRTEWVLHNPQPEDGTGPVMEAFVFGGTL